MKRYSQSVLICAFAVLWCAIASAHPNHGGHDGDLMHPSGFAAGLLHPILGIDHLLAMLAVGLLSAQLGGRALWAVPGCFVGAMLFGGLLGMMGFALPAVEAGIALSIVVLGVAIAVNRSSPLALCLAGAALFGVLHGFAHGAEAPRLASPTLYAIGFVSATIALHVVGVVLGRFAVQSQRGTHVLRWSAAMIAVVGLVFLIG
jgi:urease accessory protein